MQICIRPLIANISSMQICIRPLIANIRHSQICIRRMFVNISPMQICKRALLANIDKKSLSDIAVKVVGAFASNAPLRAMVGGAHLRGATLLGIACGCLSANYTLGSRLTQTRLLHRILGSRLGEVLLLRCRGVLLANMDGKTFSGNAVKVVGAFASNAPM